jgi:predicted ester cyclase
VSAVDLKEHYLNYIAVLNERRFDDLKNFVADELVYNDAPMNAGQYRQLLEDDVRTISDLFFDVQQLVGSDEYVACRIRFDCTPVERFQGFEPSGSRIVFAEHVFYRFQDDHITQVWSLLDIGALQRQLAGTEGRLT